MSDCTVVWKILPVYNTHKKNSRAIFNEQRGDHATLRRGKRNSMNGIVEKMEVIISSLILKYDVQDVGA